MVLATNSFIRLDVPTGRQTHARFQSKPTFDVGDHKSNTGTELLSFFWTETHKHSNRIAFMKQIRSRTRHRSTHQKELTVHSKYPAVPPFVYSSSSGSTLVSILLTTASTYYRTLHCVTHLLGVRLQLCNLTSATQNPLLKNAIIFSTPSINNCFHNKFSSDKF